VAKYRVLSLDGGGIRGILTALLLERILKARPAFLADVNLFAGTSTGSILAIGLAKGLTPPELIALYREQGPRIFHQDILHDLGSLWGFRRARYQTKSRFDGIYPSIGDITLDDLLPRHVLVATYQLDCKNEIEPVPPNPPQTWKAKFFHNYIDPAALPNASVTIVFWTGPRTGIGYRLKMKEFAAPAGPGSGARAREATRP